MKLLGAIGRLFAAEFPTLLAIEWRRRGPTRRSNVDNERERKAATLLERIRRYEYPIDYELA